MSLLERWKIKSPSVDTIRGQLLEKRALPQGGSEFEEWADRIISGALITADETSLKFALANMITHLGPTESHKEDAFFIHQLKKSAANQVAVAKIKEYTDLYKKKEEDRKAAAAALVEPQASPEAE